MTTNPLAEADPKSFNHLMSEDPLKLTDEDVDELVKILRRDHAIFLKKEKQPKAKERIAVADISLDELDIKL